MLAGARLEKRAYMALMPTVWTKTMTTDQTRQTVATIWIRSDISTSRMGV